jgi:hypothetical protein
MELRGGGKAKENDRESTTLKYFTSVMSSTWGRGVAGKGEWQRGLNQPKQSIVTAGIHWETQWTWTWELIVKDCVWGGGYLWEAGSGRDEDEAIGSWASYT